MKTPNSKSLRLLLAFSPALCLVAPRTVADEPRFFRIVGPTAAAITTATPDGYITWTNAQVGTNYTIQTARRLGAATNWVDYVQIPVTSNVVTNRLYDPNPPAGMVLIPEGSFTMGDTLDGNSDAPPTSVMVSAFYMDVNLVTYALWTNVYQWATNHSYTFPAASGKAASHPVQSVYWYNAVQWCNARSEMEGRTPCYYTNASLSQAAIYRSGRCDVTNDCVNWAADGYRLPTEAEWEKAARGGAAGHRFPWADADTIDWSRANYEAYPILVGGYPYDVNPISGYDTNFTSGGMPYSSPVGSFPANGYGLYDMAGNACQWCWDWYSPTYYSSSPGADPLGPTPSPYGVRVKRGGSWDYYTEKSRCANRGSHYPNFALRDTGFRCVRRF